jgi:hypothetical protein
VGWGTPRHGGNDRHRAGALVWVALGTTWYISIDTLLQFRAAVNCTPFRDDVGFGPGTLTT